MKDVLRALGLELDDKDPKAVSIKEASHEEQNHYNQLYNLPFSGIGSAASGSDWKATQIGCNEYEVMPIYPYAWSARPQAFPVDAATMSDVINNVHLPHIGLPRISSEEQDELEELENELNAWRKQQRLSKFKLLPSFLRQEIVNEMLIRDLNSQFDNMNDSGFDGTARINELRSKQSHHYRAMRQNPRHASAHAFNYPFKYTGELTEMFTTEELMNAHAEASIEDELADD